MTTAAAAPSTMASSSSSIVAKELDPYRDLPQSLRTTRLLFSTAAPSMPATLSDLLSLAPSTIAARITSRSVPLTNPPRVSSHSTAKQRAKVRRAQDAIRKGTIGLLPRVELKRRGIWQPRPGELSWTSLGGLRDLWEGYAVELLGLKSLRLGETWEGNPEGLQAKLIKADFTGAYVKVTAAANISLVGIEGIVLHETEQTFKLFTQSSTLKVIPKLNTTFTLSLPLGAATTSVPSSTLTTEPPSPASSTPATPFLTPRRRLAFDVYGSQLIFRSADRAGRKFKTKPAVEIAVPGLE